MLPQTRKLDLRGPTSKGREGREGKGEREGKEVEELGGEGRVGEGREEGGGEGVGAPFNVLPPGATDLVAPLREMLPCGAANHTPSACCN